MSCPTISRGTPHFLTTVVQPLVVYCELLLAPVVTLHQVSIAAAYRRHNLAVVPSDGENEE